MSRMKPKSNKKGDISKPSKYDSCQTPPYALAPLLPYIKPEWTIWEPAVGQGMLRDALPYENDVIGTDITQGEAFNFFTYSPYRWDAMVTNPPFSVKYEWLGRSYELGRPFALLLPVETLGASKAQKMLDRFGFEIMLLDSRVDFYMPEKGWSGKGAQFPTLWLCWNMLPERVMFGSIKKEKEAFKKRMKNEEIQRRENSPLVLSGLGNGPSSDKEEDKSEGESLVFDW